MRKHPIPPQHARKSSLFLGTRPICAVMAAGALAFAGTTAATASTSGSAATATPTPSVTSTEPAPVSASATVSDTESAKQTRKARVRVKAKLTSKVKVSVSVTAKARRAAKARRTVTLTRTAPTAAQAQALATKDAKALAHSRAAKAAKALAAKRATTAAKSLARKKAKAKAKVAVRKKFGSVVLHRAAAQKGKPYRYGSTGPRAFDCSGLVIYVMKGAGVKHLPRTAAALARKADRVSKSHKQPGDLVFFTSGGHVYHVGVYAGHGKIWHSPSPGHSVSKVKIWTSSYRIGRLPA